LPTSLDLLREREFRCAALFARLRGNVTMSYCAWDAASARASAPSPIMLHALRMSRRAPSLTFAELEDELGRVVCAVPVEDRSAIDGDDVWMAAIAGERARGGGGRLVVDAFPGLAKGLAA